MRYPSQLRNAVIRTFEEPKTPYGIGLNLGLLLLIYASVGLLIFEVRYPEVAAHYNTAVTVANRTILAIFSADLIVRLIVYHHRLSYLFSFYGLVDLLSVVPGLLAIFVSGVPSLAWLRTLRIVRFLRFIRLMKFSSSGTRIGALSGGTIKRLVPWMAIGAGIKGLIISAEALPWWPGLGDMSVVLSVSGFAIAVLLGAKLSIVQSRFYDLEDAICRVLGSITDMPSSPEVDKALRAWVYDLRWAIEANTDKEYIAMRQKTAVLEQVLERNSVGGPVTAGFHRDVEFILHRLRTRTPVAIEQFLWYATCVYASVAILAVPGLTGFAMVLVIIFVLGGMYFVIDDMDSPLKEGVRSRISIDLTPLYEYLENDEAASASGTT